ncbi:MAG: hypothetical protein BWY68_00263 [bacterium ADurb.Bin400]|nr:MAG: hypothetical protein BWY68_00263 [bacterium ADurb.Bin400]
MSPYWYLVTIPAIVIFWFRRDLRREMIWSGLLALPVLIIKPLSSTNFLIAASSNPNLFLFILERAVISFTFGAIASALYETLLHKRITPIKRPYRSIMLWLAIGPVILMILHIVLNYSIIISLLSGLLADILVIIIFRPDLFWDLLFSGLGMGTLYLLIFSITSSTMPGDLNNLWFTDNMLGLTFFGLPVEEIVAVILFGALWGPLYVAIKDLKEIKNR